MNQAILRNVTNNSNAKLQITIQPFPNTQNIKNLQNTVTGFLAAFVFSIGMSFIPASIISYIVKEREINIKH